MTSILKDIQSKNQDKLSNPERHEKIEKGKVNFREYCNCINSDFFKPHREYQDVLCNTIQDAYEKKLINEKTGEPYSILIINMPPGFGKSYSVALFNTFAYGQDVKNATIAVSYNATLATRFSKTVRDTIEDKEIFNDPDYYVVNSFFPKVKIKRGDSAMDLWSLEDAYMSYLATGFDGSITGMRGNLGIIDDPIKSAKDAVNDKVKEDIWDFYKNTFRSRMLDGALQIIIQTRWAVDDLAGRLISTYPDRCYVLEMKALDENNNSLCEDLYSTKDLFEKKDTLDEEIWEANYMQEPIDKKGALYQGFQTWDSLPSVVDMKVCYIDTADTGADFLCAIGADVGQDQVGYVTDIYYTDESMDTTEDETAKFIARNDYRIAVIESNNGGRGFRRNVERILKTKYRYNKCTFVDLHQSKNKQTRILTNATNVISQLWYPPDWAKRFPDYYLAMTKYQRKGKNAHDDGPDGTTGLVEVINGDVEVKKGKWGLSRR
jgi:predicted phage terminase large subunit-like protein